MSKPIPYDADTAEDICKRIASGKSLVKVCGEVGVSYDIVLKWLRENNDFAVSYARAREDQADFHADAIIDIADTEEDPNKARVRIDARKWAASKLRPVKYGDKIEHTGPNGAELVTKVEITYVRPDDNS